MNQKVIDNFFATAAPIYNSHVNGVGERIGVMEAYELANKQTSGTVAVASLPLLLAAKSQSDYDSDLWESRVDSNSEKSVGQDMSGVVSSPGSNVLAVVHGGGLYAGHAHEYPYRELVDTGSASLSQDEFESILRGILPSGKTVPVYSTDEIKAGEVEAPFGDFVAWTTYDESSSNDGLSNGAEYPLLERAAYPDSKQKLLNNPILLALAGTTEYLEDLLEKTYQRKNSFTRAGERYFEDAVAPVGINVRLPVLLEEPTYGFLGISPESNMNISSVSFNSDGNFRIFGEGAVGAKKGVCYRPSGFGDFVPVNGN